MNIMITGGAGFIASHVVEACIEAGHRVAIVDNFSTGKKEHTHPDAILYEMDITGSKLAEAFAAFKPEVVVHHAAQIDVGASIRQPVFDASVNITGTIALLEQCREHGVRKMIYASSAAVYGSPISLGITETHPVRPESCYGISKLTGEHYVELYGKLFDLDYTIFRYANVYGTRQDPMGEGGVISIFIDRWLKRIPPVIYGDGEQTRDFVFVKDVVAANIAALTKGRRSVLNIGTNLQTSINDLHRTMCEIFGVSMAPVYNDGRQGDIEHSRLDNRLALEYLGWKPTYTLSQGLEETCDFYQRLKTVR